MKRYRLNTLRGRLPATICSEDTRVRVEELATQHNLSMGEVQRIAIEFFLMTVESKTLNYVSESLTHKEASR